MIKCQICDRQFSKFSFSFHSHLKNKHKLTSKEYYDKYLKSDNEELCSTCNKSAKFQSIGSGYRNTCGNKKCISTLRKNTNLLKYGTNTPAESNIIKEKCRNLMLEKYGVEHALQNEQSKRKMKLTCLKNFGKENAAQSDVIKDKIKKTCIRKYGVSHHMQNREILEKFVECNYKFKTYALPSGEIIKIQGYEDRFLDEYFAHGGKEENIVWSRKEVPKIYYYTSDGKKHRYYPDFFIPKDNLIIEVKSEYTYKRGLEKNILKEDACKKAKYGFKFIIY